jgi:uncharacterized protein (DUF2062 family)
VVFRRRKARSYLQLIADSLYPRGGWGRAASYVMHRLRRLPDPPHKIARGIFAGIFVTFSPLFGLHFVLAAIVARLIGGNILASLLATFFGNPLTFLPIGVASLKTGHFLLGTEFDQTVQRSLGGKFNDAGRDLFGNLFASISGKPVDWTGLARFSDEVFLPYLVGGIIPGLVAGLIAYYLSVPIISAYQKSRLKKMRERAEKRLAKRAAAEARAAERDEGNGG